ncbi:hypothetical protein G6F45_004648 [Rhizopus arrhizus]|nr:hypothetical protein G6F45_004648 [Rhizopus arrhizus]
MNKELVNKYLEFRKTSSKIGLEEALVQFRSIGEFDWKFEVLRELLYITSQVKNENSERASTTIRATVKRLNNETFLLEHNQAVIEIIELFEDIEYQESNMNITNSLVEGFVYLSTRCVLFKAVAKSNEIIKENIINQLLLCVRRLSNRFLLQLSEMIYGLVEENPEYAQLVRLKLSEMQILPDVITKITVLYCEDESDNNQARVTSALRVLVGIAAFFGIKLNESEVDIFTSMLNEAQSERIVKLVLCLVLVAADQFLKRQKSLAEALYQSLQCDVSEMPLLFLVYFQTDKILEIEDTIRSILAMQVPIRSQVRIVRNAKAF